MIENELVRHSILKLLNCNSLRYFGLLVYNFEFVSSGPPFCPTYAVGLIDNDRWNIWYNSEFVNTHDVGENVYIIIHEIIHSISGHCFRKAGRNNDLWGLSTDHIMNVNIDRDIDAQNLKEVKKPHDRLIVQEIEDHFDWTAEMVYEWLQENGEIISMGSETFIVALGSSGAGVPRNRTTDESDDAVDISESDQIVEVVVEKKGLLIKTTGNIYPLSSDLKMSDGANSQAAQSLAAQARAHANADRTRGLIGGNLRHLLKDIIDIQIPPERILENAIRAQLQKGEERSWRIPNKRLMAHNIIIPSVDVELQFSDVIFMNDHSGSISDKEIQMFSGVMKNCAQLFTRLHIIKHDYNILRDGGITVMDREQLLASKVLFEAVGRGGTSHQDPFKYVQNEFDKGTPISLVIGLTDWASDIQIIWDRFTFHKHIPVIWVVPHSMSSMDPRYGKVLPIIEGRRIR